MDQEDYKLLNYYLNGCFKELEKNDSFLLRNIFPIAKLSDQFVTLTNQYVFKNNIKPNHLTCQDVYLSARKIIESIDKNYLLYYDDLIKSGQLDFSYNNEYPCSQFVYNFKLININREFNYIDVCSLVHEFMHYMNYITEKTSVNSYLLMEFISIYFEEYSKTYLINNGISKDDLFLNERIMHTKITASNFNWHSLILLSYDKFGDINENTWQLLNEYYLNISKEDFEDECKNLLMKLKKVEENYKMEIMYEEDFKENELFEKQTELFNKGYRYILGTILAYHALEQDTFDKIVYLCNHINDFEYAGMGLLDVLETIDIDIEQIDLKPIEKKLIQNNTKKVK